MAPVAGREGQHETAGKVPSGLLKSAAICGSEGDELCGPRIRILYPGDCEPRPLAWRSGLSHGEALSLLPLPSLPVNAGSFYHSLK